MDNKELYYFLGKCLSAGDSPEFVSTFKLQIDSDDVDWEKFVRLASTHLITPLLYPEFLRNKVLGLLPDDLITYFKEIYRLNCDRNIKILGQIEEINSALNSRNILPVYLKGAGNLLDDLYKDPGERIMSDIDLLTSEEDFFKTADIIRSLGYNTPETQVSDILTCQHYPILIRDGTVAGIEVHRLPVPARYASWFNYNIISGEMRTPSGRPECRVLSDKHKVILCFIHSQLSHQGHKYGTVSMRDVYDLVLISKRFKVAEISFPKPFIRQASDYMYLIGKITGTQIIGRSVEERKSLFLWKHKMNLTSVTFRRLNLMTIQLSAYVSTFFLLFTSRNIRSSIFKKLTSREWYRKHLKSWKNLIRA